MTEFDREVERFLPLTPAAFHILLSLAQGERHGYGIMLEVEAHTQGRMNLGPGTLYRTIRQLQAAGLIEAVEKPSEPTVTEDRRRFYRLTSLGHRVAQAEAARLEQLVQQARASQLLGHSEASAEA